MTKNDLIKKIDTIGRDNISLIVTVVQLPSGAKEVIVNSQELTDKIDYLLQAYDENLVLKTFDKIRMLDFIIL